jgi:hypothetical protein
MSLPTAVLFYRARVESHAPGRQDGGIAVAGEI